MKNYVTPYLNELKRKAMSKGIVKSEISYNKGKWSKEALNCSKDVERAISEIIEKHKHKLSYDAIHIIIASAAFCETRMSALMDV